MSYFSLRRPALESFFRGIAILLLLSITGCGGKKKEDEVKAPEKSYAIYAEFAKESNVPMKKGLNRRVFNTVEAQEGTGIELQKDGSITLQPGSYRITGFSMVTMQAKLAAPVSSSGLNYPGYCLVYERDHEENDPLKHQIGIGSPSTALDMTPSLFDLVFSSEHVTQICVGHQSGDEFADPVYLSVYAVDGVASPYHVFARIAIFRQDEGSKAKR